MARTYVSRKVFQHRISGARVTKHVRGGYPWALTTGHAGANVQTGTNQLLRTDVGDFDVLIAEAIDFVLRLLLWPQRCSNRCLPVASSST